MIVEIFKKYLENTYGQDDSLVTSLSRSISNVISDFFISNASYVSSISNSNATLLSLVAGSTPINLNIPIGYTLLLYNLRTNETFNCSISAILGSQITISIDQSTDLEINDRVYDLTDFYDKITPTTPEIVKLKNYSSPEYANSKWLDAQGLKYNVPRQGLPDSAYSDVLNYYPLAHFSGMDYSVKGVLNTLFQQNLANINYFDNLTYNRSLEVLYNQNLRISQESNIGQNALNEFYFFTPNTSTEWPNIAPNPGTSQQISTSYQALEIKSALINASGDIGVDSPPYSISGNLYHVGYYAIDTESMIQSLYGALSFDSLSKTPYRNLFPNEYSYFAHRIQDNTIYMLAPYYINNSGFTSQNQPFLQWEPVFEQIPYIKGVIVEEIQPFNSSETNTTDLSLWDLANAKQYFYETNITQYTSSNTYTNSIGIALTFFLNDIPQSLIDQLYSKPFLSSEMLPLGNSNQLGAPVGETVLFNNPYVDLALMPGTNSQVFSIENGYNGQTLPDLAQQYTIEFSYFLSTVEDSLPKTILSETITTPDISMGTVINDNFAYSQNGQYTASTLINNNYYIIDSYYNRVLVMSQSNVLIQSITNGFNVPLDIVSNSQYFYVSDEMNNQIQVFSSVTNTYAFSFGSGVLNHPRGLAIDSNYIYIADSLNNKIQIYTLLGNLSSSFSVPDNPEDVEVDSNYIYVTYDSGSPIVLFGLYVYDHLGNFVRSIILPPGDGSVSPRGIAVDSTYIYLTSNAYPRIPNTPQVFVYNKSDYSLYTSFMVGDASTEPNWPYSGYNPFYPSVDSSNIYIPTAPSSNYGSLHILSKNVVGVQKEIPLLSINSNRNLLLGYMDSNLILINTSTPLYINPLEKYNFAISINSTSNELNLYSNGLSQAQWSPSSTYYLNNTKVDEYTFDVSNGSLDNIRLTNSILYPNAYTNSTVSPDMFSILPSSSSNEVFRMLFNNIYTNPVETSTTPIFGNVSNGYVEAFVGDLSYGIGFYDTSTKYYIANKGMIHLINK